MERLKAIALSENIWIVFFWAVFRVGTQPYEPEDQKNTIHRRVPAASFVLLCFRKQSAAYSTVNAAGESTAKQVSRHHRRVTDNASGGESTPLFNPGVINLLLDMERIRTFLSIRGPQGYK
jgi:hypothetical protein